jgi:limonene-1,2-epoxide hydrolase
MRIDAFRKAVEASDLDAAVAGLSPDVVLHSPITFKPFVGRDAVAALFGILFRTFEDFRYVAEFTAPDGAEVLHFRTRVGDRDLEGIDMVRFDSAGLIEDFTVMVRPLSAALALRDAVGAEIGATPA